MTINKYTNEKINKHYMIDSLFAENFERSDQIKKIQINNNNNLNTITYETKKLSTME